MPMNNPTPNLSLYHQLAPNVSHLARMADLSRTAIYALVYGSRNTRPATVEKFNQALSLLLKERMALAKKMSART